MFKRLIDANAYNVEDIASYLINKSLEMHVPLNNFRLQSMLYFVQAESLASKGKPLFDDDFLAYDWGVGIPTVYQKYSVYAGSSIFSSRYSTDFSPYVSDLEMIDRVLESYARYSGVTILEIIRNQKPWQTAYKYNRNGFHTKISKELLSSAKRRARREFKKEEE